MNLEQASPSRITVLTVEDQLTVAVQLRLLVEKHFGGLVKNVKTLADAMAEPLERYDGVVLDAMLPDSSSMEDLLPFVLRCVEAGTPVVLYTAYLNRVQDAVLPVVGKGNTLKLMRHMRRWGREPSPAT